MEKIRGMWKMERKRNREMCTRSTNIMWKIYSKRDRFMSRKKMMWKR